MYTAVLQVIDHIVIVLNGGWRRVHQRVLSGGMNLCGLRRSYKRWEEQKE
jgi:hypothetical protein